MLPSLNKAITILGKFPKGRGMYEEFSFQWVFKVIEITVLYFEFPIDSGNKISRNAPPVEIIVRFFVIYFPFLLQLRLMLSIMFMGRQVKQNANEQRLWRPFYSGKAEKFIWPRQPRVIVPLFKW